MARRIGRFLGHQSDGAYQEPIFPLGLILL